MVTPAHEISHTFRPKGLVLSPAAAAKKILEARWRFEALVGVKLFHGELCSGAAEQEAMACFEDDLIAAALRLLSANVIHHHTWHCFLRESLDYLDIRNSQPARSSAIYFRFQRWFRRRNPDVMEPPSQRLVGAYLNYSGFKRSISGGRTIYPQLRLKEK